jgi:predicted nucleic acid-binding protein
MANPSVFLDANVLLYTDDPRYPEKREIAVRLVEQHVTQKTGAVSLQILGEYFHNARRKMNLDVRLARQRVTFFSRLLRFQPNLNDVFAAIDLHQFHHFRYWDAMIVHSAVQCGCRILYSEDMHSGHIIDNLKIVNPFVSSHF